MFNFFKRKKKTTSEIPATCTCQLRDIPCSHADPEGLENCRMCEHYNFWDYLEWKRTGKPIRY